MRTFSGQWIAVVVFSVGLLVAPPADSRADQPIVTVTDLVAEWETASTEAAIDVSDLADDATGKSSCANSSTGGCCGCECCRKCEAWLVGRESLFCDECWNLDCVTDALSWETCRSKFAVTGGAHHWWHQSFNGAGGGYGIPGLRNTYFWYLNFDAEHQLESGRKVGTHVNIRLRETGTFRGFVDQPTWPWEAYAYLWDGDWGTIKGGLIYTQFGLFWDNAWFGNAAYFDGFKLDADYGFSWEKTHEVSSCFKVDMFTQFFLHEDQSNGSFGGGDAESVVDYTERNTGIFRIVPTWTQDNGGVLALGVSAKVGQIDSRTPTLADQSIGAWGADLNYTRGRWRYFAEGMQHFGIANPVRYVSGGPSNRITNFLAGGDYTLGPVTYRCAYSASLDANPDARQNMIVAGATIMLTKNLDLYVEYVNQRIDGNAAGADGEVFDSMEYIVNWHF